MPLCTGTLEFKNNEVREKGFARDLLRCFPIRWWKCDMPESRNRGIEFHWNQKSTVRCIRRPRHAAPDPLPRTVVFEDETRIRCEVFRTRQQRSIVIHVRGMCLDCFRLA